MSIELTEKPKNPTILEGFPGFGFVSTITTEFLIKHLNAKKIGRILNDSLPPLVVIHDSKIMDSIEVYYAVKENLVILRTLTNIAGAEWKMAEIVSELATLLKAKEIISVEGVASAQKNSGKVYYFSSCNEKKFQTMKMDKFKDGIVMGVTGIILMKADKVPVSCIFAEATAGLPDSRAAGEIIKVLDKYLGLDVDYKPLMKTAEEVEDKLRGIISKIKESSEQKEKKEAGYLG
jgi:uncharacterized protein